ncbi:hypothetical protein MVEN_00619200 [Mycena venus]|uniref:RNA helicase n=1 Tax=Mycena venus TaxID=2733690 RepID=A0A8H6YPB0_9AGAR|nr:hypothetical protein MVEN_00619200 [Mycena venus]
MKPVTIFDGYKYVGTMQICVRTHVAGVEHLLCAALGTHARLRAGGCTPSMHRMGRSRARGRLSIPLVQALLQAPDYSNFEQNTAGWTLYYLWGVITCPILLNILISLFSSAYQDVVDDAEAQYLAFFASKTVGMIRAPDSYVYPAPFNLIEVFLISPFELFWFCSLSPSAYAQLNRVVMAFVFFVPLSMIAFYESVFENGGSKHAWMKRWLSGNDEGENDRPEYRDPEVDEQEGQGRVISKVKWEELIKAFPNTSQSSKALMLKEILELKKQLAQVLEKLDGRSATNGSAAQSKCRRISKVLLHTAKRRSRFQTSASGTTTHLQRTLLPDKPDVVIATPSRALALMQSKSLVIDEADLILSYGHDEDVRQIFSGAFLQKVYQSFLMSATMTEDVEMLKGLTLRNPAILKLEETEDEAANLSQYAVRCAKHPLNQKPFSDPFSFIDAPKPKFLLTYVILKLKLIKGKCILFVNDVERSYRLKLFLEQFSIKSCVLNSELPLNSRYHTVQEFNKARGACIHDPAGDAPLPYGRRRGGSVCGGLVSLGRCAAMRHVSEEKGIARVRAHGSVQTPLYPFTQSTRIPFSTHWESDVRTRHGSFAVLLHAPLLRFVAQARSMEDPRIGGGSRVAEATSQRDCTRGVLGAFTRDSAVERTGWKMAAMPDMQFAASELLARHRCTTYPCHGSLALWAHNLKDISCGPAFVTEGCSDAYPGVTAGRRTVLRGVPAHRGANITLVGGSDATVGLAGGFTMGGGHGVLSPVLGLGADRVFQYKIVTPDGQYRTASACQNEDLFFALRGVTVALSTFVIMLRSPHHSGGGSFSVVLDATILAAPAAPVQSRHLGPHRALHRPHGGSVGPHRRACFFAEFVRICIGP